ncbi:glycine-rich RNA-binding protein 4, mitochondrial [Morus notabilis]|nr:glycine-rich RNA-binding protein 4, mitochondrial [Morus notabilis]XP_024031739.1 glycine-rich RNA-binding protein 4, mitochondrial [Morus notabilis]
MAFRSKGLGVLRQSISGNVQSPMTSMLNSVRCISSRLFVGGLSYATDDQSLRNAFSGYGDVIEAKVACDEVTGNSKGFGFVTFNNLDSASSAVSSMDRQELQGRKVHVRYAYERGGPYTFGGASIFGGRDGGYNLENPNF